MTPEEMARVALTNWGCAEQVDFDIASVVFDFNDAGRETFILNVAQAIREAEATARRDERERCAKVADRHETRSNRQSLDVKGAHTRQMWRCHARAAKEISTIIRALGDDHE